MRQSLIIAGLAIATSFASAAAVSAKTTVETNRNGSTYVNAPGTRVAVQTKRPKVHVEAPYTTVKVDTAARSVKIRVPFYNGDITW